MKGATLEKFHLSGGGIKILGTQGWEQLGGGGFVSLQAGGGTDPGWHYDYLLAECAVQEMLLFSKSCYSF